MDWFQVLKKVREFCPNKDSTFKVVEIEKAFEKVFRSQATVKTDSYHIASGWVGKLVKWKYIERVGSEKNGDHKPIALYAITEKGRGAEDTSSSVDSEEELSNLDQLRDAVRVFEGARAARQASMGKKAEPKALQEEEKAFAELLALCDKLDREEFGVE